MPEHILMGAGGASETTLAALLAELQTKLDAGGTVALDAPTLAALEQVTATIANLPADYPDAAALTALGQVLAAVQALPAPQADALTRAELDAAPVEVDGTVQVGNFPATQTVAGTVALDASTLAALEQTTVTVSNPTTTVAVSNLPATQVVSDGGGSLTVDGTVAISGTVPVSAATPLLVTSPERVATGALSATDATVELQTGKDGSAFAVGIAGTWVGTVSFERTIWTEAEWAAATGQAGNTRPWTKIALYKWGSPFVYKDYASTLGQVAEFHGNLSASEAVRVRFSTRTSGTVLVKQIDAPSTGTITVGAIAAGPNLIGATADPFWYYCSAAGSYTGFNATTDVFTTANNTNEQFLMALVNPAGSGKALHLWRSVISLSNAGLVRRYRNPTLTNTTAPNERAIVNRGGGSTTPVAKVYRGGTVAGSTSMTLGTGTVGRADHLPANSAIDQAHALTLQVQPGQSIAFTVQFTSGGLSGATVSGEFAWAEVTL